MHNWIPQIRARFVLSPRPPFRALRKRGLTILLRAHRRDKSHGVFVCYEPRSSVSSGRAVVARKRRNRQVVQRRMHLARGLGSSLSILSAGNAASWPPSTGPPCAQRFRQPGRSHLERARGFILLNGNAMSKQNRNYTYAKPKCCKHNGNYNKNRNA